jgi:hypothetical protein
LSWPGWGFGKSVDGIVFGIFLALVELLGQYGGSFLVH